MQPSRSKRAENNAIALVNDAIGDEIKDLQATIPTLMKLARNRITEADTRAYVIAARLFNLQIVYLKRIQRLVMGAEL